MYYMYFMRDPIAVTLNQQELFKEYFYLHIYIYMKRILHICLFFVNEQQN